MKSGGSLLRLYACMGESCTATIPSSLRISHIMQSISKITLIVSVCGLDARNCLLVTKVQFAVRNAYKSILKRC
jgi:hypothetical protein